MKAYLNSIIPQIKSFSESLDKTTLFVDKAWAYIDEDNAVQKLIFKRNNELILSKNGKAEVGRWEYYPAAKSILIDRVTDKILCNEQYIDNGVMILKVDGTNNEFFALANENIVPDLDVYKYLVAIKKRKNYSPKILERRLIDGRIIEIEKQYCSQIKILKNDRVLIEETPIQDGKYQLEKVDEFFEIKDGIVLKSLTERKFINPEGVEINVQMQYLGSINYGDYVYISGKHVENEEVNFSKRYNLIVKDGIVIKLQHKLKFLRWLDWTITIS